MRICEFNGLSENGATMLLAPCVRIPSWAQGLAEGRPYDDAPTLLARASELAQTWSDADVLAALADHPRIGERPSSHDRTAELSRTEQAGVDPGDLDVQERLRAGNARYEERFGRIYLVRAAGRDAAELLDLLEQRLENDVVTEMAVTKAQLTEIALLRLAGLFS